MGTLQAIGGKSERSIIRLACTGLAGTSVEWYDFFLYGTAAALVFPTVFFPKEMPPAVALLSSFSTFAVGFAARPIGAILFGHFGDRVGRKAALAAALMLMGIVTTLIGLIPPYAKVGVLAPVLLVVLRFGQGLAIGGQWGGAVLLIAESAPSSRRGFYTSFAQAGVKVGLLLSNGALLLAAVAGSNESFISWTWRIPFVASLALVGLSVFVKLRVEETVAFNTSGKAATAGSPVLDAVRLYPTKILLAAGTFVSTNTVFYLVITFVVAYGSSEAGLHLPRATMLSAVLISAVITIPAVIFFGALSDRLGRRPVFMTGAVLAAVTVFLLFPLLETRSFVWITTGIVLGLISNAMMYGPQAAMFAELFATRVRYTAVSVGYQLGSVLGGAIAPIIATAILATYHSSFGVSVYIAIVCAISFFCVSRLKETCREELTDEVSLPA